MDVSVIIVSYNSSNVLCPCLDSLRAQQFPGVVEVVVVDNASIDDSAGMVERRYPQVRVIRGRENVGYSRGVNMGIREATGKYLFILNPDTVLREHVIAELYRFAESTPDAGVVAPKLVFQDGNVQPSCRRFYTLRVLLMRRTPLGRLFPRSRAAREHMMEDFDHQHTRVVDWVLGAAMFVRRAAVETVGLMDERFFLYFEDVDWCYRMHQNGLKVYYHPAAVITHGYQRESAQSVLNRSFVSHFVSLFRYYEKWHVVAYFIKRYREVSKVLLFLGLDILAFNAAFFSAYYLRVAMGDVFANPLFPIVAYDRFILFENLVFIFTYAAMGLYVVRRETRKSDELFDIVRAALLGSVLLMTSTYLGQIRTYSRLVVAFVVPFTVMYDWALRSGVRYLHSRIVEHKVDLKRVFIIGEHRAARELEARLVSESSVGYDVVGSSDPAAGAGGSGLPAGTDDVESIVDRFRVQEVIVLPGALSDDRVADLIGMGRRRALDVTVMTDYTGLAFQNARVTQMLGRPVISYARDTRYAADRLAKRLLDGAIGVVMLLISVLPFVIYCVVALLRGGRPFAPVQKVGLEGEPFTMPLAGENRPDGPSDFVNLPLFWLVIVGRLSLVGPYAVAPEVADRLDVRARFRFAARPGVTGLWRDGGRQLSVDDMLAHDVDYLRNWSLSRDVRILLATLPRMFAGRSREIDLAWAGEEKA